MPHVRAVRIDQQDGAQRPRRLGFDLLQQHIERVVQGRAARDQFEDAVLRGDQLGALASFLREHAGADFISRQDIAWSSRALSPDSAVWRHGCEKLIRRARILTQFVGLRR